MGRAGTQRGFTLIELLVTITILGIFAAVAVPSFTQLINNNRVQSANNELVATLQYARAYAVENRTSVRACLEAGVFSVKRSCDDSDSLRAMDVPAGVDVDASELEVQFRQNGSAGETAVFTTCRDGDAATGYTIVVMATGNIRAFPRGMGANNTAMSECTLS